MSNTAEAALYILIGTLISTVGAWITARITSTGEKPSETFEKALREERNLNAQKEKQIVELRADIFDERRKRYATEGERDQYAAYALELRKVARKYAPTHLILPELESNGTTPPDVRSKP